MSSDQKPFVPKTAMDFQKLKLERLMANPDKPVLMPETRKEKGFSVPEFVRNVMGSSAGAGSGEFHVYRHLRRKEYTRQKMIEEKGEKEHLDEEYRHKIEENKRKMEEKMAKKRLKRLKKKAKFKQKKKSLKTLVATNKKCSDEQSGSSEESDECQVESSNPENKKSRSDQEFQGDSVSERNTLSIHLASKDSGS